MAVPPHSLSHSAASPFRDEDNSALPLPSHSLQNVLETLGDIKVASGTLPAQCCPLYLASWCHVAMLVLWYYQTTLGAVAMHRPCATHTVHSYSGWWCSHGLGGAVGMSVGGQGRWWSHPGLPTYQTSVLSRSCLPSDWIFLRPPCARVGGRAGRPLATGLGS